MKTKFTLLVMFIFYSITINANPFLLLNKILMNNTFVFETINSDVLSVAPLVYLPSTVSAPGQQISAGTLSSISTDSVAVLQFIISDGVGDGLSTYLTGVKFFAGANNDLDFQANLAGGGIYDITNSVTVPITAEPTITSTTAFLPISLTIPEGGSVILELYTYLNTSNANDGDILQFKINATASGFTTDASGSSFEEPFSGGDIISNNFTVDVVGTQFTFLTQPSDVAIGNNMSNVVVGITDINENIDLGFSDTFIQLLFNGSGSMFGINGTTAFKGTGTCTFSDLNFDTQQTGITLSAHDGNATAGFNDVQSTTFDILGTATVNWCNLQWPNTGSINQGDNFIVYAQAYEPGVTDAGSPGAGINAWIGYSETNTNPNTWTNWIPCTFNTDVGNNDEYKADIGASLPAGNYFFASKFQLNGGIYKYGGYNSGGGNFWDGTTYTSGTILVNGSPEIYNESYNPMEPTSSDVVTVSATITDETSVYNANVFYSTTSPVDTTTSNKLLMTNGGSGNEYSVNIPLQSNLTKIYFVIAAVDNTNKHSVSSEYSYTVQDIIPPEINNINTIPRNPTESDGVKVSAELTDSDGSIDYADLFWSKTTPVDMFTSTNTSMLNGGSGDIYTSNTAIPAQTDGTTIYYLISAYDNKGNNTISNEYSYTVHQKVTIHDIQYTTDVSGNSPLNGNTIYTGGIVTKNTGNVYFIQDNSGAWNGIYVNDNSNSPAAGDSVTFTADVLENANNTELNNISNFINVSSGNTLYAAETLTTASANDEAYESVLIYIPNATCTNANLGNGEWEINDGSGAFIINDLFYAYISSLNTKYNITGIQIYDNSAFNIAPRDANDIETVVFIENIDSELSIYPNPANNYIKIKGQFLNVNLFNSLGQELNVNIDNNIVNLNNLSSGIYTLEIVLKDGQIVRKKIIKK